MKVVAFLATTIIYGIIYLIIDKADSSAFGFESWIDPFYFSFTTMSTVGYGDHLPKSDLAKMTVMSHQTILILEIMSMLFDKDELPKMPAMPRMGMPRVPMMRR
jgi:voltage-gated potassium channel